MKKICFPIFTQSESVNSLDYDDAYPTCEENYATLGIYHEDLDPENINKLLDLTYSWSCRKGDPIWNIHPEKGKRKLGTWLLRTEGIIDSKDCRRHIDWLLDQIEDKAEVLEKLRQSGYRIDVGCYWVSKHGQGGPTVSPAQSNRLARLKIELGFDVYFAFDEDEEC